MFVLGIIFVHSMLPTAVIYTNLTASAPNQLLLILKAAFNTEDYSMSVQLTPCDLSDSKDKHRKIIFTRGIQYNLKCQLLFSIDYYCYLYIYSARWTKNVAFFDWSMEHVELAKSKFFACVYFISSCFRLMNTFLTQP